MYKLYRVYSKFDIYYQFILGDEICPKEYLKERTWMDVDLRTLKEIDFPKGRVEYNDLDSKHVIFYNGEPIVIWDDEAVRNYPEDLCWTRDISGLLDDMEKLVRLQISDEVKSGLK